VSSIGARGEFETIKFTLKNNNNLRIGCQIWTPIGDAGCKIIWPKPVKDQVSNNTDTPNWAPKNVAF